MCFKYLLELNLDSTSIYITWPSKPPQLAGNEANKESFKQNCNLMKQTTTKNQPDYIFPERI